MDKLKNTIFKHWPFFPTIIIGLYLFSFNISGFNNQYFPGDLGDGRFNNYLLEHNYQYALGNVDDYWNAPFMVPEKEVLSYSDNLIGSAPFYMIFRFLNQDRETSYILWMHSMFILSFLCCYLFLFNLFNDSISAVLGALIFTTSIALQSQMTHAQVFPRFAVPLTFLFAFKFCVKYQTKYFLLTVFSLIYQFYCGIYLGFLLMIPITVYLILNFINDRKVLITLIKKWQWTLQIIGSILAGLIIFLPLILPYLRRSEQLGKHSYLDVAHSLPTYKSFFYSHRDSFMWNSLNEVGNQIHAFWDHQIFPGGIAMICTLVFAFFIFRTKYKSTQNKTKHLWTILITAIFVCALFIRIDKYSLYYIIHKFVPGFGSMRSLTRIINIELIFFAIATSFCFNRILSNKKYKKYKVPVFMLGLVLISLDNYVPSESTYRTNKSLSQKRIDDLIVKIEKLNLKLWSTISYEPEENSKIDIHSQIDAMIAAQQLHLKCINGYSATSPYMYDGYWWNMNESSRIIWLKQNPEFKDSVYVIK